MKKKYTLSILLILTVLNCFSNNITISNATLVGKNTVDGYTLIQFDIAWDNSWRTGSGPSNWDAAWVFIKYRIKGQNDWHHASLNWADGTGTGDGHTVPAGAAIKGDIDTGDGNSLGVFIYSSGNKTQGTASYPGVQLRWQYEQDGIKDDDLLEICVFGIEMVYVPQGAFEIGNNNFSFHSFYTYPTEPSAYLINSEAAISVSGEDGDLYYAAAGDQEHIPASFPKGYKAFYCMKYEITQEQYVEFLLKLTDPQSGSRAYTLGGNRNEISGAFGTFTTTSPYVACNYLNWKDLAAYLDWAALRPMTELEYEKACRGPLASVILEFAWGNSARTFSPYTLSDPKTENEGIETNYNIAVGNLSYSNSDGAIDGPLRVGIFSAHPNNSGRVTAGASYYGIMEMTGNVFEQTVTVGNINGRGFKNIHGDGVLAANGDHDTSTWPGVDAIGAGQRGGGWTSSLAAPGAFLPVGSRTLAITGVTTRENDTGGRGIRTAP
jgi:formylglycine-generating enzyme required for sulfatase activity